MQHDDSSRSRATRGREGRRRVMAAAMGALTVAGAIATAVPASAALTAVGPESPDTKFPSWYRDGNGTTLELCLGSDNCLFPGTAADLLAEHAAPGGDAEAFYYAADATAGPFALHNALEAAYNAPGAAQEVVFMRTQVSAKGGGLQPGATYTVTDPYGSFECTADAAGVIVNNACRIETDLVRRDFSQALSGRIGPFLTPANPAAAPAGFLGNNVTAVPVTGSPSGFNRFRVTGPGLTGTCPDGTANCVETNRFVLQGKVAPGLSASLSQSALDFGNVAGPITKTIRYVATGSEGVTVSGVTISGAGAADFSTTNDCPTPLIPGAGCTITVTYTPRAGTTSNATLTITDDTPASPRTVSLTGESIGVAVADRTSLAFADQAAGTTSPAKTIVVTNSGGVPLTVTGVTFGGTSPDHYKVASNNCTTLNPGAAGCEIGISFAPKSEGTKNATATIATTGGDVVVRLAGTGLAAPLDGIAPSTPSGVSVTATAVGTLTARWNASTDTGGSGLAGYDVYVDGSTTPRRVTTPTDTLTGLAAGSRHSVVVQAVDGAGNLSGRTTAVTGTAWAAPGQPGTVTATAGNASATVRWAAPASGGTAITGYKVRAYAGTSTTPTVFAAGATATSLPVTGLTNGTAYTFDVIATNAVGDSPASTKSASVTPAAATVNQPPTVTARTPLAGATGVNAANDVTATFSEAVQGVSGSTFTLRAAGSTTNVVAGVSYNATTRVATLNPTANLAANTQYTATLTGGATAIRDTATTPASLATTSWTFTTGNVAPTVTARTPASSASNVLRDANVTATFSEGVTGVSGTTFTLRPGTSTTATPVAAVVSYNATTRVATLNPNANLPAGQYTARLTGGIVDGQNAPLAAVTWSFTVNPTLTARTPGIGATGASRTANITATFSDAVTGVSGTTFTLRNATTGASVTAVVSYNATTRVATLNPNSSLAASTRYTATLTGGATAIRTPAGTALATTTWSFTTGTL